MNATEIKHAVAQSFRVRASDIEGRGRSAKTSEARFAVYYLLSISGIRPKQIGQHVSRGYWAVNHGIKRCKEAMSVYGEYRNAVRTAADIAGIAMEAGGVK